MSRINWCEIEPKAFSRFIKVKARHTPCRLHYGGDSEHVIPMRKLFCRLVSMMFFQMNCLITLPTAEVRAIWCKLAGDCSSPLFELQTRSQEQPDFPEESLRTGLQESDEWKAYFSGGGMRSHHHWVELDDLFIDVLLVVISKRFKGINCIGSGEGKILCTHSGKPRITSATWSLE